MSAKTDAKDDAKTGDGERIHVHFVESGITAHQRVYTRGDELIVERGSERFRETQEPSEDGDGFSWLDLADDPSAQLARWGRVMFTPGPFPESERIDPEAEAESERIAAWHELKAKLDRTHDDVERSQMLKRYRRQYGEPPVERAPISKTTH